MKKIMCKNPLAVKHAFLLDLIFQLSLNFPLYFLKAKTKKESKKTKEKKIKCTTTLARSYLDWEFKQIQV